MMSERLMPLRAFWYQGVDALLRGDDALAQDLWMSAMLECQVEEVEERTEELVVVLEETAIALLQVGSCGGAKKCYEMAQEVDETFENSTLDKILRWRELYTQDCERKGYQFATDWFSNNIPVWNQVLRRFVGSPNLSFLEVGSWEGRSTCWLLDHILTDPLSTITCIDTFEGSIEHGSMGLGDHVRSLEEIFDHNVEQTGRSNQVKKLKGLSQDWLCQLPADTFDFYYVDGSHVAPDVLADAVLGWRLPKPGGIMVFDDYEWIINQDKPTLHPKLGVDSFLAAFRDQIRILYRSNQVICEKVIDT